jgi:hypothetical protein
MFANSLTFSSSTGCLGVNGYFQVYSAAGSMILENSGFFETSISRAFLVGEPESIPPTVSSSPSASLAPTHHTFPITIAVQLDQWSGETGLSFESNGGETLFDFPTGNFTGIPATLFIETVSLPNDSEVTLKVTDTGGDGFCESMHSLVFMILCRYSLLTFIRRA